MTQAAAAAASQRSVASGASIFNSSFKGAVTSVRVPNTRVSATEMGIGAEIFVSIEDVPKSSIETWRLASFLASKGIACTHRHNPRVASLLTALSKGTGLVTFKDLVLSPCTSADALLTRALLRKLVVHDFDGVRQSIMNMANAVLRYVPPVPILRDGTVHPAAVADFHSNKRTAEAAATAARDRHGPASSSGASDHIAAVGSSSEAAGGMGGMAESTAGVDTEEAIKLAEAANAGSDPLYKLRRGLESATRASEGVPASAAASASSRSRARSVPQSKVDIHRNSMDEELKKCAGLSAGTYAVALCTCDGQYACMGDYNKKVPIMEAVFPLLYAMAMEDAGAATVNAWAGTEPSSHPPDSFTLRSSAGGEHGGGGPGGADEDDEDCDSEADATMARGPNWASLPDDVRARVVLRAERRRARRRRERRRRSRAQRQRWREMRARGGREALLAEREEAEASESETTDTASGTDDEDAATDAAHGTAKQVVVSSSGEASHGTEEDDAEDAARPSRGGSSRRSSGTLVPPAAAPAAKGSALNLGKTAAPAAKGSALNLGKTAAPAAKGSALNLDKAAAPAAKGFALNLDKTRGSSLARVTATNGTLPGKEDHDADAAGAAAAADSFRVLATRVAEPAERAEPEAAPQHPHPMGVAGVGSAVLHDGHAVGGVEPSRDPKAMPQGTSRPYNACTLAGALAVMSCVGRGHLRKRERLFKDSGSRFTHVVSTLQQWAGDSKLGFNNAACLLLKQRFLRCMALSHYLKGMEALPARSDPSDVAHALIQCMCIEAHVRQLATLAATFARAGSCPTTDRRCMRPSTVKNTLSMTYTCGMGPLSGAWTFNIALPATVGSTGVTLVVIPGLGGLALLDTTQERLTPAAPMPARSLKFCEMLVREFRVNMFDALITGSSDADGQLQTADQDGGADPGSAAHKDVSNTLLSFELTTAVGHGDLEKVVNLIKMGADVTSADYDMRCALHIACCEGHVEIATHLLRHGADPLVQDRWSQTPFAEAVRCSHSAIVTLLESHLVSRGQQPPNATQILQQSAAAAMAADAALSGSDGAGAGTGAGGLS
jgi:glutaminase